MTTLPPPTLENILAELASNTQDSLILHPSKAGRILNKMFEHDTVGSATWLASETANVEIGNYLQAVRSGDKAGADLALGQVEHFITMALAARKSSAN